MIDEAFSGGPAGLIYGFIIVWAGTAAVFASLSELASMYDYNDPVQRLLSFAGHLLPEGSITGSRCLLHSPHENLSAMSRVFSKRPPPFSQAEVICRLAHSLGLAGQRRISCLPFWDSH